jgi:anti-sigma B factor antagonist
MSLKVKSRKLDSVVIVDMDGRLTSGEPQFMLRETIRRFIDEGNRKFVLNLTGVSHIDTSGLGELAATRYSLAKNDGHVNLLGLTKRVKDLMVMTHLALVFDLFDEESKAVTALLRGKPEPNGEKKAG